MKIIRQDCGIIEGVLKSVQSMADGSGDVVKEIEFVSGEGRVVKAAAFWDGGRTWRVRAALPEVGLWDYRVDARDGCFLPEQMAGSIEVSVPETQHPTLSPGRLRVAADGFHLEDGNGRPFSTWPIRLGMESLRRNYRTGNDILLSVRSRALPQYSAYSLTGGHFLPMSWVRKLL